MAHSNNKKDTHCGHIFYELSAMTYEVSCYGLFSLPRPVDYGPSTVDRKPFSLSVDCGPSTVDYSFSVGETYGKNI